MNKKQVTAFLKVISKDIHRPTLNNAYVGRHDGRLVMYGTDGYVAAMIYIDEDAAQLEGKYIRRDALERWARAATGKSRLTADELIELSNGDYGLHGGYYEAAPLPWDRLFKHEEARPTSKIVFDGSFAKIIQDLADESLELTLHGNNGKMVMSTDMGVFMLMPIVKKEE